MIRLLPRLLCLGVVIGCSARFTPIALAENTSAPPAITAITPRTNLPPEADDPLRPKGTRWLRASWWTDDAGVDDAGNIYHLYRRSAFGTWSNYDEALANPFPLSDPLVSNSGVRVTDAATWQQVRRPEILEAFRNDFYGRAPNETPAIKWTIDSTTTVPGGESSSYTLRIITGRIDNTAFPEAKPVISLALALPTNASGPVPVIVIVSSSTKMTDAAKAKIQRITARGWGCALFEATALQPDSAEGLSRGIIGLMNQGAERRPTPDAWGALSAWAWGLSRVVDYLETVPSVDTKRLGVQGHSRWGKTALWAAAQDERWSIVFASCSGEGGAKPSRRNFGETLDNIARSHWVAENLGGYGGGRWNTLPVDAPELLALLAPRPAFITGATQDPWADPRGQFMAVVTAGPVYRLLGARDVGTTEMPAPDAALVSGDIAYRLRQGWHTDEPDWPVFLEYAAKYFGP